LNRALLSKPLVKKKKKKESAVKAKMDEKQGFGENKRQLRS
jgi:hypothetical protein